MKIPPNPKFAEHTALLATPRGQRQSCPPPDLHPAAPVS